MTGRDDMARDQDFARRLNHLFATVPRPNPVVGQGGCFLDDQELTQMLNEFDVDDREQITAEWVRAVRHGRVTDVGTSVLYGLAAIFRVPPAYFTDAAVTDEIDNHISVDRDLIDRGVSVVGPCRFSSIRNTDMRAIRSSVLQTLRSVDRRRSEAP